MATKKAGKVTKASAKVKASASVKASADITKITKASAQNARKGVKQYYTDKGAQALIALMAQVSGAKLIDSDLRMATKNNASARRAWCAMNGAVTVSWLDVQKVRDSKGGQVAPAERPDNAIRARVFSLANIIPNAKKVGYVRVLDAYTAKKNPTHSDSQKVYLYRVA